MTLAVKALSVGYGSRVVLRSVELRVEAGRVAAVLGPSGSGKTTLLRGIAGLLPVDGSVLWDREDVTRTPPHRRRFGLMFQEHALFPHRDVGANVAFGPRMLRWGADSVRERVAEVLALVGLEGYERRSVEELSGGERQRVSLARALAPQPRALLLDEPLASLDRPLRERLARDLRALVRELGIAAVYVTHDQQEAFSVADDILVLRDGEIVQRGPAEEVWRRPRDEWVARFLGFQNVVRRDGACELVPADAFRPSAQGAIRGFVRSRSFRGDHHRLVVVTDGGDELDVIARWQPAPAEGDELRLTVDRDAIVPLGSD